MIQTPTALIHSELDDINQSKNIDSKLYDLWDEHHQFILHNNDHH